MDHKRCLREAPPAPFHKVAHPQVYCRCLPYMAYSLPLTVVLYFLNCPRQAWTPSLIMAKEVDTAFRKDNLCFICKVQHIQNVQKPSLLRFYTPRLSANFQS